MNRTKHMGLFPEVSLWQDSFSQKVLSATESGVGRCLLWGGPLLPGWDPFYHGGGLLVERGNTAGRNGFKGNGSQDKIRALGYSEHVRGNIYVNQSTSIHWTLSNSYSPFIWNSACLKYCRHFSYGGYVNQERALHRLWLGWGCDWKLDPRHWVWLC